LERAVKKITFEEALKMDFKPLLVEYLVRVYDHFSQYYAEKARGLKEMEDPVLAAKLEIFQMFLEEIETLLKVVKRAPRVDFIGFSAILRFLGILDAKYSLALMGDLPSALKVKNLLDTFIEEASRRRSE